MTRRSWLRAAAWNEFRAMAPIWGACVAVALCTIWLEGAGRWTPLRRVASLLIGSGAPLIFGATPLVLGGLSIGHELSHRTLGVLLTQPISRGRLFATKIGMLAALVLSAGVLSLLAYRHVAPAIVSDLGRISIAEAVIQPMILVPLLGGLVLAPWFTLVCRSVVGGVVLALAAPAGAYLVALLTRWLVFGSPDTFELQLRAARAVDVTWVALTLVIGAVGLWRLPRTFMNAEERDASGPSVTGFSVARPLQAGAPTRHRSPWALLLSKELRLQIPTFVIAGLFAAIWVGTLLVSNQRSGAFEVYQIFFGVLIPLLAGSVATAEEREMGVLDGDAALPLSPARRYLLKLAVVMGTAIVLTVGLVTLLGTLTDTADGVRLPWFRQSEAAAGFVVVVLLIATVATYVSSLSHGGLRTLIIAGAACFAVSLVLPMIQGLIATVAMRVQLSMLDIDPSSREGMRALWQAQSWLAWRRIPYEAMRLAMGLGCAVLTALALSFAYRNHRLADRGRGRPVRQVAWLLGLYATGIVLMEIVNLVLIMRQGT